MERAARFTFPARRPSLDSSALVIGAARFSWLKLATTLVVLALCTAAWASIGAAFIKLL
jgi:hypothetical protein